MALSPVNYQGPYSHPRKGPDSNMPNKKSATQNLAAKRGARTFGKTGGTMAPVTYEPTRGTT